MFTSNEPAQSNPTTSLKDNQNRDKYSSSVISGTTYATRKWGRKDVNGRLVKNRNRYKQDQQVEDIRAATIIDSSLKRLVSTNGHRQDIFYAALEWILNEASKDIALLRVIYDVCRALFDLHGVSEKQLESRQTNVDTESVQAVQSVLTEIRETRQQRGRCEPTKQEQVLEFFAQGKGIITNEEWRHIIGDVPDSERVARQLIFRLNQKLESEGFHLQSPPAAYTVAPLGKKKSNRK